MHVCGNTYLLRVRELKGFLICKISVQVVSRKDFSKKAMNGRAEKAELDKAIRMLHVLFCAYKGLQFVC